MKKSALLMILALFLLCSSRSFASFVMTDAGSARLAKMMGNRFYSCSPDVIPENFKNLFPLTIKAVSQGQGTSLSMIPANGEELSEFTVDSSQEWIIIKNGPDVADVLFLQSIESGQAEPTNGLYAFQSDDGALQNAMPVFCSLK